MSYTQSLTKAELHITCITCSLVEYVSKRHRQTKGTFRQRSFSQFIRKANCIL